jgi:hypothetical protein
MVPLTSRIKLMSAQSSSRTSRLRDVLGAAIVAIGVSVTLTAAADSRPSPASAERPLATRLREAKDSLDRLHPPGLPGSESMDPGGSADSPRAAGQDEPSHQGAIRWTNYWVNFNPWRNWNNWNNWHNFNQWVNI